MESLSVTIQMKATEQYFPVVLFIMLYKVVLTFESVDETVKCDHSKESYWAVLSGGAVFMLYKVVLLSLDGIRRYNDLSESFCEYYFIVLFTEQLSVVPCNFWVCA